MTKAKKIGIILIVVGLCLPTATLPFITGFHPQPNICLTFNFFNNFWNMVVVFGSKQINISGTYTETMYTPLIAITYRYLFTLGIILVCPWMGTIVLSSNEVPNVKSQTLPNIKNIKIRR